MAANLSLPILPFSPSKTHRLGLFTASTSSSRTNLNHPSRAPRVLMALSPLQKDHLLSFSFFPTDVLTKTEPPQNPSSPSPSDFNFSTDDDKASDLKTGEPAPDLPPSGDVDSPAPHSLSSSPPSDANFGSDMGDHRACNLKAVKSGVASPTIRDENSSATFSSAAQ